MNYKFEIEVESFNEAELFVLNEKTWSYHTTNPSEQGDSLIYRCNMVKAKKDKCASGIKILVHANNSKCSVYRSSNDHTCGSSEFKAIKPMTLAVKEFIEMKFNSHMTPALIMDAILNDENLPNPSLHQLKNYVKELKEQKFGPNVISLGDLEDKLNQISEVPASDEVGFCFKKALIYGEEKGEFRFFITTKILINNAILNPNQHITIDTTYKVTYRGYPLFPVGTTDKGKHFHLLGFAMCSSEKAEDFQFVFSCVKEAVKEFCEVDFTPKMIMADGADAITLAIEREFPGAIRLMCWYHAITAIEKRAKTCGKENREKILADIRLIHLSPSKEVFEIASRLFCEKWTEEEPDFVDYFKTYWLAKNCNWYLGISTENHPSTNNAQEGYHSSFKKERTIREQMALGAFIKCLTDAVEAYSKRYSNNVKIFEKTVEISKSTWTNAYQFLQQKKQIKMKEENGETIHIVPNHEYILIPEIIIAPDEWIIFEDFKENFSKIHEVQFKEENWKASICSCPAYFKEYMCKHVIAIAARKKLVQIPPYAKNLPLMEKRKPGRPAKAKKALIRD